MKTITISITGDTGSGKSIIGTHILKILTNAGLVAEFCDDCVKTLTGFRLGSQVASSGKVPDLKEMKDVCKVIVRAGEDPSTFNCGKTPTIYGIGSIISFYDQVKGGDINKGIVLTDTVCSIQVYDDGRISYITDLYIESAGNEHEIMSDRITHCYKHVECDDFSYEFPLKTKDYVRFKWDGIIIKGRVKEQHITLFDDNQLMTVINVETKCHGLLQLSPRDWSEYELVVL